MRTSRMCLAGGGGDDEGEGEEVVARSLFAQSVQLNVSPTYADPKDTGRLRIGLSKKGAGFVDGVL